MGKGILKLYVDGASRGNPGEAGAGFYLVDEEGNEILRGMRFLGSGQSGIVNRRPADNNQD